VALVVLFVSLFVNVQSCASDTYPARHFCANHPRKLDDTIRDLVRLGVERVTLEGYQQGFADGKRRTVNWDLAGAHDLPPNGRKTTGGGPCFPLNPMLCFGGTRCGH